MPAQQAKSSLSNAEFQTCASSNFLVAMERMKETSAVELLQYNLLRHPPSMPAPNPVEDELAMQSCTKLILASANAVSIPRVLSTAVGTFRDSWAMPD
jgi:hypothetical protein